LCPLASFSANSRRRTKTLITMFSKIISVLAVAVALAQEMPGALACDGGGAGDSRVRLAQRLRSGMHSTDRPWSDTPLAATAALILARVLTGAHGPLCALEPVGTGIETRDGSVVFLAPNEGAFVRDVTYQSSQTELSGMNVARALPRFLPSPLLSRALCVLLTVGVGGTSPPTLAEGSTSEQHVATRASQARRTSQPPTYHLVVAEESTPIMGRKS
jgi:hypothetical protein